MINISRYLKLLSLIVLMFSLCCFSVSANAEDNIFGNSGCYVGENYLYLPEEMTAQELKAYITSADSFICSANSTEISDDSYIPTGATIAISRNGAELKKYTVVLLGDTDCNGIVDISDARKALRISVGLDNPSEYYVLLACDVDSLCDESIEDARGILRYSVGLEEFSTWFFARSYDYADDSVLITMSDKYLNPDKIYEPDLFDKDMVGSIKVLELGNKHYLTLYLTQPSKENVEILIRRLNDNPAVESAGKNYMMYPA